MKRFKKLSALFLALALVLGLSVSAMAATQTVTLDPADDDNASITIENAAKGETYKIYKLFDATVTGTKDGSIAYQGTIPDTLSAYFTADEKGNISANDPDNISEAMQTALKKWAADQTPTNFADSNGSTLKFDGLPYGYYVVTSTLGTDAIITVTSTNPDATIYDKNSTSPTQSNGDKLKTVDNDGNVSIGDTVTFTIKFKTTNYEGAGNAAKQILNYIVTDTAGTGLDAFTDVTVKIANEDPISAVTTETANKVTTITIPWTDDEGTSLYDNGAEVVITYKALVNSNIEVGGAENAAANKNSATVKWTLDNGNVSGNTLTDSVVLKTYAAAIQKVDENDAPLAGATFSIRGLVATGENGNYTVVTYDPNATTTDTVLEADDNGLIVINGIKYADDLIVTEESAPDGYNKLTGTVTMSSVKTSEKVTTTTQTTTTYYDADGKVVDQKAENGTSTTTTTVNTLSAVIAGAQKIKNSKGEELPSTGGMGTTIFYAVGGVMVVAAAILLIAKKRMGSED
jgi:fimbrial isopeptide formation D2 family protein/LPXTG-motif cell wall-anchored protein